MLLGTSLQRSVLAPVESLTRHIPLIVPNANYGAPDCCGIIMPVDRGRWTELTCSECGAIVAIIEPEEAKPTLLRMAISPGICTETCPNCGEVNTFPGFSSMDAYRSGIVARTLSFEDRSSDALHRYRHRAGWARARRSKPWRARCDKFTDVPQEYTIKLGVLLNHLQGLPADTDVIFGDGNLDFHRTKWRGNLFQIEFRQQTFPSSNEAYNREYERRKRAGE